MALPKDYDQLHVSYIDLIILFILICVILFGIGIFYGLNINYMNKLCNITNNLP